MEWSDVISNPQLQNLSFKIELNKFGKLLLSPRTNKYGMLQGALAGALWSKFPEGKVITECSVQTSDGVKVADAAWASAAFIEEFGYTTPYIQAPELCIEIVSPSNSKVEIAGKVDLYLAKGAREVWVVYDNNVMDVFTYKGQVENSTMSEGIREQIFR